MPRCRSAIWSSRPRTSTVISATRRMHRLRVHVHPERSATTRTTMASLMTCTLRRLRLRRRPAGLRDERRADRDHDVRGPAAVPDRFGEPLGLAGGCVLQRGEGPHRVRQLHPRLRGHAVVRILRRTTVRLLRRSARADRPLVPRPLRHRARPGRGVRRAQLRRDRELHDHGRRALVRLRPQVRAASRNSPKGSTGFHGWTATRRRARTATSSS